MLTALRKEPQRRYFSVAQFAEDIRRHLAGLPVTARKDTVSYRTSKFIERNKARLITAAVILVALLAGVATIVRQIRVAKTERAKFEAQQARFDRPLDFTRAGDYVSVASSATLNPSAAMTITVWFTVQKSEDLQFLVSKFNHHSGPLGRPADDSYALGIDLGANIYWQVETVAGSSVVDNIITVHQPHTLYDGRFHHVAGTYDGAAMVIYVDGNHGTLVGNTMFAPGKAGQAFNFNRE